MFIRFALFALALGATAGCGAAPINAVPYSDYAPVWDGHCTTDAKQPRRCDYTNAAFGTSVVVRRNDTDNDAEKAITELHDERSRTGSMVSDVDKTDPEHLWFDAVATTPDGTQVCNRIFVVRGDYGSKSVIVVAHIPAGNKAAEQQADGFVRALNVQEAE